MSIPLPACDLGMGSEYIYIYTYTVSVLKLYVSSSKVLTKLGFAQLFLPTVQQSYDLGSENAQSTSNARDPQTQSDQ